ncbi:MAG TPA: glucan biosynthesis protein D [Steroidobacteraceae bacterium]|jgi:glucans biosynthesis protein|nr:glucan biosynthesis protein D [Steroidobacteraceae bacterium]
MSRRRFLRSSAALLTVAGADWLLTGAADPARGPQEEAPAPFDYARLKGLARARAAQAYAAPAKRLPPSIATLDWDHWQAIRFREERALWAGEGLRLQVQFAHPGYTLDKPVRMYEVNNGAAREIAFDPSLFDYTHAGIGPAAVPANLGFGGLRIFHHTDWTRDCASFQGASYFRAVDGDLQYGMSQRGLAVNCGMAEPEEFPDFIAYYLERPAKESSRLTLYALLDSPSVTGAYRFVIDVGDTMVMDVDSALYPRRQIERLGIAPATSMFLCGKNDRRVADDWRPEIHDSDGLQICTGAGEWIWRPLVNPAAVRVNSYLDDAPRGFGLMQRERQFAQYQDDGVFYDKRPSMWIEPKASWRKGAVMLVEIPTPDETQDNVVAFWTPEDKPQPGVEYLYGYRLYWCRDNPHGPKLAVVVATRTGVGGQVGVKRNHFAWRFVVDFAGGELASLGEHARVVPIITASRGRVELASARRVVPRPADWRAAFDLALTNDIVEPLNLRLFLALDGQALTETWLYQYTPPPPAQRKV